MAKKKNKLKRPVPSPRCFIAFDAVRDTYYSATLRKSRLLCWNELVAMTEYRTLNTEHIQIVPVRITPIRWRRRSAARKESSNG